MGNQYRWHEVVCKKCCSSLQFGQRYKLQNEKKYPNLNDIYLYIYFVYITGSVKFEVYRYHNYRGLPEVCNTSGAVADSSACI